MKMIFRISFHLFLKDIRTCLKSNSIALLTMDRSARDRTLQLDLSDKEELDFRMCCKLENKFFTSIHSSFDFYYSNV
ncbi:hypothetical protein B2G47_11930 [Leptospira interrogans serovar Canicola]|nr:hypothetical protein B2G47_11930 [Leptospira interrogans serovar Canicola]